MTISKYATQPYFLRNPQHPRQHLPDFKRITLFNCQLKQIIVSFVDNGFYITTVFISRKYGKKRQAIKKTVKRYLCSYRIW